MTAPVLAWVEDISFAECPKCEETQELGTGLDWKEPLEWECEECGATFVVSPPARESKA